MKSIEILLVEDNEGDILLTTEALADCKILNNVSVVRNGKEALNYLYNPVKFDKNIFPDIILLDVNLPLKNGHEVLAIIKNEEALKHIPVIMLTTSSSVGDVKKSYNNYANCHIVKPVNMNDFSRVISSIENFWFSTVALPGVS